MNASVRRVVSATVLLIGVLTGCASTHDGRLAVETFGHGLKNLILSPFMIVAGIVQGLAFLPYTLGTGLAELNRGLLEAQAVSLDDSYQATFGVSINDPRVNPQTGEVAGDSSPYGRLRPGAIAEATAAFQRLLVSQGMAEDRARHYVIAAVYTHTISRDHILLSVVHRHPGSQPFRVVSKHTAIPTLFRPGQMGWYEPYPRDAEGRVVDEVIDWVALEYSLLRSNKVVATLMSLGVEAVKSGKRMHDYWPVEQRWIAGETGQVIRESLARVQLDLPPAASPGRGPAVSGRAGTAPPR